MIPYIILIILAISFSYWAAKSKAFSWATGAAMLFGFIIALGGTIALIFDLLNTYANLNIKLNTTSIIVIIVIVGYLLTTWLVNKKTEVFVPKDYQNNYLIIIYDVKGAKKILPSLTRYPKTFKLKFPQSGILTTSEIRFGNGYYFSMCKVLEENGKLYLPNKKPRFFYPTSKVYNDFRIDILFLDNTGPSENKSHFDFLNQIDFTDYKKIEKNR